MFKLYINIHFYFWNRFTKLNMTCFHKWKRSIQNDEENTLAITFQTYDILWNNTWNFAYRPTCVSGLYIKRFKIFCKYWHINLNILYLSYYFYVILVPQVKFKKKESQRDTKSYYVSTYSLKTTDRNLTHVNLIASLAVMMFMIYFLPHCMRL